MNKHIAPGVRIREYKSGKRRLVIAFSYRGRECRETLSALNPSKRSAQRYAVNLRAEILSQIERGTFDYAEYFPDSPRARLFGHAQAAVSVRDAQAGIIADLELAGRAATTVAAYTRSAKRINRILGGDRQLRDLSPEDFRDLFRRRPVSRKCWTNDLIPIRKALQRAVMDGAIAFNPLDRVNLDELLPKRVRPKPDPFTLGEISEVLKAASGYCERAWNLIETMLYTGLRIEELVALSWDDIDFSKGRLYVTKAAQLSIKSAEIKPPKTAAGERVVDLLPKAVEALKRQQKITRFKGGHVFVRWHSFEPFSSYDQLRLRWVTILGKTSVRYRPLKQCRHTFISHMLSSGENPLYLIGQTGHQSPAEMEPYMVYVKDWKGEEERKYGT